MGEKMEEENEDKNVNQDDDEENGNDDEKIQNELDRLNEQMNNDQKEEPIENNVAVENDYGYAAVHAAFKQYFAANDAECTAAPKLLLFAKKNGISGVTFANSNKYLKARKNDPSATLPSNADAPPAIQPQQQHIPNNGNIEDIDLNDLELITSVDDTPPNPEPNED